MKTSDVERNANMKKSIKKNAVINSFRTILNLIFPLITFPYVSRILSVEDIGVYNFSNSIITYFLLIAALGIDKFAIREGTKYRDNREEFSAFASKIFSINIISTLISYGLLFITLATSDRLSHYSACILIFSIEIFFTTLGTEWIYSVFEEYKYITARSIVFKIISVVLLFIIVRREGDYINYTLVSVFASVGSNVLNFFHARKFCDIKFTFKCGAKEYIKPILFIFASNIAVKIYVNADTTMLGLLATDYAIGIYSVATKIYSIIKNVLVAIVTVTIPRFALYVGRQQKDEYDALLCKVTNALLLVVLPAITGLIMLRENVISIISSEKYIESQYSLAILSLAIVFSIFSTLFNQCVLLPYKREKIFLRSSIISALINIGLNFIFIPYMGATGAAITTLISEFLMTFLNFIGCKDLIWEIIFNLELIKNLIWIIIGCVGIVISCSIIKLLSLPLIILTVIQIAVSVMVYGVIVLISGNRYVKDVLNGVLRKL